MENELRFTTDLADARWTCSLISDRKKSWIPEGPITATIYDMCPVNLNEVKYPFKLTLEGTAPVVQHTTNISVLEISEYDNRNSLIKTVRYSALVVNVSEIQDRLKKMDKRLAALRLHIDEKAAMDVDTTPAEEKYHLALSNISTPCCKSAHDVDNSEKRLIVCDNAITEGEVLLNKSWAEKTVADAEEQLRKANDTIDAIHANLSRTYDNRLNNSYMMRDRAASGVALAKDNITQGNFSQARIHAEIASEEADVSRYEALDAEKRMADPLNSLPVPVTVVVIAVLGAGLIILVSGRRMR